MQRILEVLRKQNQILDWIATYDKIKDEAKQNFENTGVTTH